MTVRFTGLEIDSDTLKPRAHIGVIPADWHRYRFKIPPNTTYPITRINAWLTTAIEGRWAIFTRYLKTGCEVTIAFELAEDGSMFVIKNGPKECINDQH